MPQRGKSAVAQSRRAPKQSIQCFTNGTQQTSIQFADLITVRIAYNRTVIFFFIRFEKNIHLFNRYPDLMCIPHWKKFSGQQQFIAMKGNG